MAARFTADVPAGDDEFEDFRVRDGGSRSMETQIGVIIFMASRENDDVSTPIRFGYKASAEQFGSGALADLAVSAEAHGFDSVFISDHLQPWRHDGGHAPASLPWLGAVGARTSRILLGTSVLTPTIRYHPGVIAQAFATLGSMYPGRIVLGVGTGSRSTRCRWDFRGPTRRNGSPGPRKRSC